MANRSAHPERDMVDVPYRVRRFCLRMTASELGVGDHTIEILRGPNGRVTRGVLDRISRMMPAREDREPTWAERRDWAAEDKADAKREGG